MDEPKPEIPVSYDATPASKRQSAIDAMKEVLRLRREEAAKHRVLADILDERSSRLEERILKDDETPWRSKSPEWTANTLALVEIEESVRDDIYTLTSATTDAYTVMSRTEMNAEHELKMLSKKTLDLAVAAGMATKRGAE